VIRSLAIMVLVVGCSLHPGCHALDRSVNELRAVEIDLVGLKSPVGALAFSQNGDILAVAGGGSDSLRGGGEIIICDPKTRQVKNRLRTIDDQARFLVPVLDKLDKPQFIVGTKYRLFRIHSVEPSADELLRQVDGEEYIAVSPSGEHVICIPWNRAIAGRGSGFTVRSLGDGSVVSKVNGDFVIGEMRFDKEGKIAFASNTDGSVVVYDCQKWNPTQKLQTKNDKGFWVFAVSPEGKRIFNGLPDGKGDGSLWDGDLKVVVDRIPEPTGGWNCATFTSDSKYLILGSSVTNEGWVHLAADSKLKATFSFPGKKGRNPGVKSVAVSPTHQQVAVGACDGSVHVIDISALYGPAVPVTDDRPAPPSNQPPPPTPKAP
jgi:hypothetical protein